MTTGQLIRYYDQARGGWHFAVLVKLGRKWAIVQHPLKGRKRVALADVDRKDWAA